MKKAIFFLILLLLLPIVQAQQVPRTVPDWVIGISAFWLAFLVAAFILLLLAYFIKGTIGRILGILGVVSLFGGIVTVLIGSLLPLVGQPTVIYEQCRTMFKPDVPFLTFPGIVYTTSCILTGYAPAGVEWLTVTTFVIFGVILPLGLLITLFWEFAPEGLITSQAARRVIAVIAALFAFRGFLATFLVEILSYGFLGIGAMAVAVLVTGYVWNIVSRFTRSVGGKIIEELGILRIGEMENIKREIAQLEAALSSPELSEDKRKEYTERINDLTKRLDELKKKVEKKGASITYI
jgi:hypothetical protein